MTLLSTACLISTTVSSQTNPHPSVWTGTKTTFTKADGADHTLEANQDRITDLVWLTRGYNGGLFNIKVETEDLADTNMNFNRAHGGSEPSGTEWALGTTADPNYASLPYHALGHLVNNLPESPNGSLRYGALLDNPDFVLHLIEENIYIDLKFTSWNAGGDGTTRFGGFSYERSTNPTLSTNPPEASKKIKLTPNPGTHYIKLSNITEDKSYRIYNLQGVKIQEGTTGNQQKINIQNLATGLYILKLENTTNPIKFIKK